MAVVLKRRAIFPESAAKLFQNVSESMATHKLSSKIFVFLSENSGKIGNSLLLAHIFRVRMVVDRVLAHPNFYFTVLVLADHIFCDLYRSIDRNQPFEALDGQFYLLLGPLLQRQHPISVKKHFSEIFLWLLGSSFRDGWMEIEQATYESLVVAHPRCKKCGLPG